MRGHHDTATHTGKEGDIMILWHTLGIRETLWHCDTHWEWGRHYDTVTQLGMRIYYVILWFTEMRVRLLINMILWHTLGIRETSGVLNAWRSVWVRYRAVEVKGWFSLSFLFSGALKEKRTRIGKVKLKSNDMPMGHISHCGWRGCLFSLIQKMHGYSFKQTSPKMLCANFGWHWSCGFGEESVHVKSLHWQ